MICKGKQVEIQNYQLSKQTGLISKCVYLNQLLNEANMSEDYLESDPIFTRNGKTILNFNSLKGK